MDFPHGVGAHGRPALPIVRDRTSLGVAIGVGFGRYVIFAFVRIRCWVGHCGLAAVSVYPILPLLRVGCLLGVVVGGGFVLLYRAGSMEVGFGRCAFAVVSYFTPFPLYALGVGFARSAFAAVSHFFPPVLRSRWVSGLTAPLSRWFRVLSFCIRALCVGLEPNLGERINLSFGLGPILSLSGPSLGGGFVWSCFFPARFGVRGKFSL